MFCLKHSLSTKLFQRSLQKNTIYNNSHCHISSWFNKKSSSMGDMFTQNKSNSNQLQDKQPQHPIQPQRYGNAKDWEIPPQAAAYDPNKKMGIDRGLFRALVIGISICIGGSLYFYLSPKKIPLEKEKENMHFFAKLNADPSVHVTYSGLMYKIIAEPHSSSDDLYYLRSPDPSKHACKILYQSRLMNGEIFDDTFVENEGNDDGFDFPAKSLISGLHQGLGKMTRDSVFEFFIPPHLAYGENGSLPLIPPHSPIVIKVKLIDFWRDTSIGKAQKFKLMR